MKLDRVTIEPLDDGTLKGEISLKVKNKKTGNKSDMVTCCGDYSYEHKTFSVATLDEALSKIKEVVGDGDADEKELDGEEVEKKIETKEKGSFKKNLGL